MEKCFELAASIVQNFIMVWFISEFCGYRYAGPKRYIPLAAAGTLGTLIITVINSFVSYDGLLSAMSVAIFVLYAQLYLKGSMGLHWKWIGG